MEGTPNLTRWAMNHNSTHLVANVVTRAAKTRVIKHQKGNEADFMKVYNKCIDKIRPVRGACGPRPRGALAGG